MDYAESSTKLQGRRLWLARAAWGALALFSIGYYILWANAALRLPLPECTPGKIDCNALFLSAQDLAAVPGDGLPLEWLARAFPALNSLTSLSYILIALFIAWRKSDDGMALWLSAVIIAVGAVGFSPDTSDVFPVGTPGYVIGTIVAMFGYMAPFATLYFFPDGRFVPRWSRWICFLPMALATIPVVINDAMGLNTGDVYYYILFPTLLASIAVGIGSMVYRYRRVANPWQRQQIKWIASGLVTVASGVILWVFAATFLPPEQPNPTRTIFVAFAFPLLLITEPLMPISVAIAVIRYRLWDIDVIIRRTLIYSALTAILVLLYFGGVVLLQQMLSGIAGQSSEIAIIASTLTIAALFNPLRRRIQDIIDHRFYRRKYDAQKVLAAFGATARDEVDLNKLTNELVGVVQETMQPAHVSLWLKKTEDGRRRTER